LEKRISNSVGKNCWKNELATVLELATVKKQVIWHCLRVVCENNHRVETKNCTKQSDIATTFLQFYFNLKSLFVNLKSLFVNLKSFLIRKVAVAG